jgi:hypothetical protein
VRLPELTQSEHDIYYAPKIMTKPVNADLDWEGQGTLSIRLHSHDEGILADDQQVLLKLSELVNLNPYLCQLGVLYLALPTLQPYNPTKYKGT